MAQLTIIYTFRDRDIDRVVRSLESLSKQTVMSFKVIFVDYGSQVEYSSKVEKLLSTYPFVTYVYNDTRYRSWNRSHALNTGIRLTDTPFVFTADVDMIFRSDFIATCLSMMDAGKAIFFSVFYLPEGYDLSKLANGVKGLKSKAHALGLGLISLNALKRLNGYDEFYNFWGKEDNDIEMRLRAITIDTVFYDDAVLLYHIYHTPVHQARKLIPDKWLSFQDSYLYFSQNTIVRNRNDNWGKILTKGSRKCVEVIENNMTEYVHVEGRSAFFRYVLEHQFIHSSPGEPLAIHFHDTISAEFETSFLNKFVGFVNRIVKFFRMPFVVLSHYHQNYDDIYYSRDQIAHFIASFKDSIYDYAYIIGHRELKIVVIKSENPSQL